MYISTSVLHNSQTPSQLSVSPKQLSFYICALVSSSAKWGE
jgi:hypothetical protein